MLAKSARACCTPPPAHHVWKLQPGSRVHLTGASGSHAADPSASSQRTDRSDTTSPQAAAAAQRSRQSESAAAPTHALALAFLRRRCGRGRPRLPMPPLRQSCADCDLTPGTVERATAQTTAALGVRNHRRATRAAQGSAAQRADTAQNRNKHNEHTTSPAGEHGATEGRNSLCTQPQPLNDERIRFRATSSWRPEAAVE